MIFVRNATASDPRGDLLDKIRNLIAKLLDALRPPVGTLRGLPSKVAVASNWTAHPSIAAALKVSKEY
jgi:hypothetical protein